MKTPVALKWTRDGAPLGDDSHDDGEGVLTVREISPDEAGDYVCVAMADRFINIARVRVIVRGGEYHDGWSLLTTVLCRVR